ncbi:MAG: family 43 glycosylhydrolase [Clostridiales bacterium]|nr:family 43 glycosylhydrolase [Clostridiales bacterium]
MKTNEINIRDSYVLLHEGRYYLYGTRSATTWGVADGFDCYAGEDLENWEGPFEIFHNDGTFWADRNYWAPECYFHRNAFYLVTTFGSETKNKGVQVLRSELPTGPFTQYSNGPVTPAEWPCIDGTLYFDKDNTPYMIFCRTFESEPSGEMYAMKLTEDLKEAAGKPWRLFEAKDASWAVSAPFAKNIPGIEGDVFLADGPCTYRTESGRLLIIWSSFGMKGYTVGMAASDNGEIDGNWTHLDKLLFDENGGHGMAFRNKADEWMYALHYPNDLYMERPLFKRLKEVDDLPELL